MPKRCEKKHYTNILVCRDKYVLIDESINLHLLFMSDDSQHMALTDT